MPVQSAATRKRTLLRTPHQMEGWGGGFWRAVAVLFTGHRVRHESVVTRNLMYEPSIKYSDLCRPFWPWPADLFDSWLHCYARAEKERLVQVFAVVAGI